VAAATEGVRRPRTKITGRMVVVLILAFVLAASFASSLEGYLRQKHNLDALEASIAQMKVSNALEADEVKRKSGDDYIQVWARQNGWAMPGEIAYTALDAKGTKIDPQVGLSNPSTVGVQQTPTPWWTTVLGSIDTAGNPKPPPAPTSLINRPDTKP
jgi:cell division protein FtsB